MKAKGRNKAPRKKPTKKKQAVRNEGNKANEQPLAPWHPASS